MKIAALIVLAGCTSPTLRTGTRSVTPVKTVSPRPRSPTVSALRTINGRFHSGDDVDLYCIHITNADAFEADIFSLFNSDTILYLFNLNGTLQVWNDDYSGFDTNPFLNSQGVLANGEYILGVSTGQLPLDSIGANVYSLGTWPGAAQSAAQGQRSCAAPLGHQRRGQWHVRDHAPRCRVLPHPRRGRVAGPRRSDGGAGTRRR